MSPPRVDPEDKRADRIAGMFDAIARRYDLLNHLLSAGLDRWWRARAVAALDLRGHERVIDVCTGTADLALAAVRGRRGRARRVLGVDFAGAMLARGLAKVRARGFDGRVALVRGDALALPAADESVDGAMVAFGIRNVADPVRACGEIARVLRPGARLVILEFGLPRLKAVRPLYLWYFHHVLPRLGRLVSRHRTAYDYLPASVGVFPSPEAFTALLRATGFEEVAATPLTFGIAYLYRAVRTRLAAPGVSSTGVVPARLG